MSINIEMNMKVGSGEYEVLYPKTLGSNIDGKVNSASSATTANSANTLTTARTIRTNLTSTSTASFDGSSNITPGVTGILGVSNGGTGTSSYEGIANNLSNFFPRGIKYKSIILDYTGNGSDNTYIVPTYWTSSDSLETNKTRFMLYMHVYTAFIPVTFEGISMNPECYTFTNGNSLSFYTLSSGNKKIYYYNATTKARVGYVDIVYDNGVYKISAYNGFNVSGGSYRIDAVYIELDYN